MKKVMVYAYTHNNLGDDLFIYTLCNRYKNANFYIYAPRIYKTIFKDIKNLKVIVSESIFHRAINLIMRKFNYVNFTERFFAKACDACVCISGSFFIQGSTKWRGYLKQEQQRYINGKPFYLLGINFGPYTDEHYYLEHKDMFKNYTDICFREQYSFEKFKDLQNVRLADDIIFQMETINVLEEKNNIVISVIKPSYRKKLKEYDEVYYKKIKEFAIYFVEKGFDVTLMSFCKKEGDEEAADQIQKLIPNKYKGNVKKHLYKTNIEETVKIIAESKFVVATRFHSMILGWIYNKPVFPIVYSKKMTNVMEDVGFKGFFTDFYNLKNVSKEKAFECLSVNINDVTKQKIGAEKHFEKLDNFINLKKA